VNGLKIANLYGYRPNVEKHYLCDGPRMENCFITQSAKPGMGVEINEEGMKKYTVKDVPFFELYGFQLKVITIRH
jgi:L-alanine-DL-glutamate epimerase-like enolase superfamily enzyme